MAYQTGVMALAAASLLAVATPAPAAPAASVSAAAPAAHAPAPPSAHPPAPATTAPASHTADDVPAPAPVVSQDAAARTRMHECGHQWSALKKAGNVGTMTWKDFSATCLVVSK